MHGFPLKPAKTVPAAGWRKSNFGHKKRHRPSDDSIFRIKNGAGDRNRTGTEITLRGILSPLRLPVPPPRQIWTSIKKIGGDTQNRTGDKGFADLCLTAWLCRLNWSGKRDSNSRPPPWQGGALPLSYFRIFGASAQNRTVDTRIFSPLLYQLSYRGMIGDPDGTRTHDLRRDRAAF